MFIMMYNFLLSACGFTFFFSSYFCFRELIRKYNARDLTEGDICDIAVKCVSILLGIMSCYAGAVIVTSVNDVINDMYWLTEPSTWFGCPYFLYDVWAMYQSFYWRSPSIHSKSCVQRIRSYVKSQPLMTFHHIGLPLIFFPCITFLRNGKGDFFVGCFYFFELATPFIASRNIIVRLKMKNTWLYVIVGLLMIIVFFLARIAIFPFMFWKYSHYKNISIWEVPWNMPIKCSLGCSGLLVLMLYWLIIMIRVAVKSIRRMMNAHGVEQNGCVTINPTNITTKDMAVVNNSKVE